MKKNTYQQAMGAVLFVFILLFVSGSVIAQSGAIKGKITDDKGTPLPAANVLVVGTSSGAASDYDGNFSISQVPAGTQQLKISVIGFKTETISVDVKAGETTTVNVTLAPDILNMDAVVVTGTQNPKSKLESSVAITTLDAKQMERNAPRNTADLLKAIPGFYVESSGGEGGNNLFARGIPADGSFRYVSMQEDGLPIFTSPEMMFLNIDLLMRVDQTIDRMESVRGGSGSIYTSNAAGGIINFITKTGGAVFDGSAKFTVSDYGLFRTDLEFGGPISDNLRYFIGGFYRSDDGIRPTGFKANDGGQIKGNLVYLMDKGHVRLNMKYMNDKNVFYLPVPLQGLDEELPGFDPNYGTMTSADFGLLNVAKPRTGGVQQESLDKGMNPKYYSFGGELLFDMGNDWILKNNFKKSIIDHQFNAIFSLNDPLPASAYATSVGVTNPVWSYARGSNAGVPISNMSSLNGNGLVADVGWWAVTMPLEDFINDLRISKDIGNHSFTAGYFYSYDNQKATWWWHNVLAEIKDQPRALDLFDDVNGNGTFDSGTDMYYTDNGFSKYGSTYLNYELANTVNALYLNDEFKITQEFTVDAGIRYEMGEINGWSEGTESYDMGNPDTQADDAVAYGNGKYETFTFSYDEFAWSVGLNYAFNNNFAVFTRASNGYRAPDDNNLVFGGAASARVEDIYQYEAGAKYSSPNLAFFITGFYSLFNDFPFSDEALGTGGSIINTTRYADSYTIGSEFEIIAKVGDFGANLTGTIQNMTYSNYIYTRINDPATTADDEKFDFEGNQVRRIPKIFFTLTPFYQIGSFNINVAFQYFGERFTDDANTADAVLPAFYQLNAGAAYAWRNLEFAVRASNLTNVIGLTEGNPRTESVIAGAKSYRMARPILGRSVNFAITYNF
ncbi:MAG: TonB-dependent receptor [Melioribacteraceae bacterium]|nr:TonB-dependent receptor [Melioribacteraceae bacterium]MCF8353295.1 TonB-dependent receptor [Melioribacteraceae bacterium]MCF8395410.1 TonB-dependent receptor [Melioribacteraceae bacterium]MCF8418822.1 TonB-dependent receptor [Melioribacteraceae bacterium]